MYFSTLSVALLAISPLVAGHGAIVKAVGDAGGQGSAIGIDEATPRDGSRRRPFQQDSTRFKGQAKATCGETLAGGDNDIEAGTQKVLATNGGTLPQVSGGGELTLTVHQVNGDGAGPYTCMLNTDGTAQDWTQVNVVEQVPGRRGNSRAKAQDFPLKVAMPAGMACTGTVAGQSNVCMVRCQNPARAGPFGGCVPVQQAGAGAAAAAPAAAAPAAAASAAPAAAAAASAAPAAAAAADADAKKRALSLDDDPEFLAELRADGEEI